MSNRTFQTLQQTNNNFLKGHLARNYVIIPRLLVAYWNAKSGIPVNSAYVQNSPLAYTLCFHNYPRILCRFMLFYGRHLYNSRRNGSLLYTYNFTVNIIYYICIYIYTLHALCATHRNYLRYCLLTTFPQKLPSTLVQHSRHACKMCILSMQSLHYQTFAHQFTLYSDSNTRRFVDSVAVVSQELTLRIPYSNPLFYYCSYMYDVRFYLTFIRDMKKNKKKQYQ